ncbi:MAG: hypothetical protein P8M15_03800 [Alphaproteobacteria bacterium]|nr:hypothetical protein [Alphaproteobacteria bacterium]
MRKLTIAFLTIVFCLTSSIAWSETVTPTDLVKRNGIYYKKYTDKPYSGSVKGTDEFGYIVKGNYKDGKEEGVWEFYYDNGQIYSKPTYKDGKLHGYYEEYLINGQLERKLTYKNGKLDGVWEEYYENGKLNYKITFENGERVK